MASLPANDRRRSERHWTAVRVLIRNGTSRVEGVSINISESGMYLFAAADLPNGAEMQLEFWLPDSTEKVRACGVVRRRALYLYGIEFLAAEASETTVTVSREERSRSATGSA